jgi:ketosteroid isomerase-like protein
MSKENVELVRKGAEDWNRGDMDAWFGLFDDDAVLRAAEGWPELTFAERTQCAPSMRALRKQWAATR